MDASYNFRVSTESRIYEFNLQSSNGAYSIIIPANDRDLKIIQELLSNIPSSSTSSIHNIAESLRLISGVTDVKISTVEPTHDLGVSILIGKNNELTSSVSSLDSIDHTRPIIIKGRKGEVMHNLLESMVAKHGFSGTIMVQDKGIPILKHGYGKANVNDLDRMSSKTPIPIGSITKPLTSLAILKLVEEGRFTKDGKTIKDPAEIKIVDFLPDNFKPKVDSEVYKKWADITLLQLMNHSSGLPSFPEKGKELAEAKMAKKYPFLFQEDAAKLLKAKITNTPLPEDEMRELMEKYPNLPKEIIVEEILSTPLSPKEVFNIIREDPLDKKGIYQYSNFGYHLLGAIVEQVNKPPEGSETSEGSKPSSYETYMNNFLQKELSLQSTGYFDENVHVAQPIGWNSATGYELLSNQGSPSEAYSSGGLYSTVEDLQLLTTKLLEGNIISEKAVNAMLKDVAGGVKQSEHNFRDEFECSGGWNVTLEPLTDAKGNVVQELWKTGAVAGYGSLIVLYPEQNSSIIILSNQTTQGVNHESITRELSRELLQTSEISSSADEGKLAKWEGVYTLPWGETFSIAKKGSNYFFIQANPNRQTPLEVSSDQNEIAFEYGPPDKFGIHSLKKEGDKYSLFDPQKDVITGDILKLKI